VEGAIREWRGGEGGRLLTRGMPAKQSCICPELSERGGSQIVVLVEICFISNAVSGSGLGGAVAGCTWDCDLHGFRGVREWRARS